MLEALIFILFWLGFCGAVATAADTRGRNSGGWFLLAFFITPLLAACYLIALPSKVEPPRTAPSGTTVAPLVPRDLRSTGLFSMHTQEPGSS